MPSVYVNFYGYDEVAHSDGPLGKEAVRALRRIDSYIGEIDRIRRIYRPETDLYILSDHGMSPALPIQKLNDKKSSESSCPSRWQPRWQRKRHCRGRAGASRR